MTEKSKLIDSMTNLIKYHSFDLAISKAVKLTNRKSSILSPKMIYPKSLPISKTPTQVPSSLYLAIRIITLTLISLLLHNNPTHQFSFCEMIKTPFLPGKVLLHLVS